MIMLLRCIDAKGIQIPSIRRNLSYGDVFEAGKELIEKNRELQYFIRVGSLEVKEKTSSFPARVNNFPTSPVYQRPLAEQAQAQARNEQEQQRVLRPVNPVSSLYPPAPKEPVQPAIDMNALAEMIASKINLQVVSNPNMVMSNQTQGVPQYNTSGVPQYNTSKATDELVFIPSTIVDTEQKVSRSMSNEKATGDDVSDALKALKKLRKGGG